MSEHWQIVFMDIIWFLKWPLLCFLWFLAGTREVYYYAPFWVFVALIYTIIFANWMV